MSGRLIAPSALLLREEVGTVSSADGDGYELSLSMKSCPLIKSKKTGVWWVITWPDLVELARASGIDGEWEVQP